MVVLEIEKLDTKPWWQVKIDNNPIETDSDISVNQGGTIKINLMVHGVKITRRPFGQTKYPFGTLSGFSKIIKTPGTWMIGHHFALKE